jgi:hypothetical protein
MKNKTNCTACEGNRHYIEWTENHNNDHDIECKYCNGTGQVNDFWGDYEIARIERSI